MAQLPLSSIINSRNPTLLPNFSQPVANGGSVDKTTPAGMLAEYPRTNAQLTATIGGTITTGNVFNMIFTSGALGTNNPHTISYTVQAGDTITTVAEALAALIDADPVLSGLGITASLGGDAEASEIVVLSPGPVGNFLTVSHTGSDTETITFSPSNGIPTGGSGPVIAAANFNFAYNGSIQSFFYGNVYNLGYDVISAMVAQGMPII
jgi:hypothetical protein